MASSPKKFYAHDIATYSDAELDQYLEETGIYLNVEDPENIPDHFIQRLRDRVYHVRDTVKSRPVNLDDVSARLLGKPALKEASLAPRSPTSTETIDDEEQYLESLMFETEDYNALVGDGGRPWYPISHLDDVAKNPGEHQEMLSVWQSREEDWKVFGKQLGKWQGFREYQRSVREQGRFPTYVKALKDRLAGHGFTRTFHLNEDPACQDKLTTWIEYVNYEYRGYDREAGFINRHQRWYHEAWKKLVDSKVLRPFETKEFIDDITSAFQHQNEELEAEMAVKSAASAVMSARKALPDPRCSNLTSQDPREKLVVAQSKLDMAIKSRDLIKRRNNLFSEFCQKTKNYRIAKHETERYSIRLRWMLQQVPLIERELNPSKVAENDSDRGHSGGKRLKRDRANELSEEQTSKGQRRNDDEKCSQSDRSAASASKGGGRPKRNGYHEVLINQRPSKRLRCDEQGPSFSQNKTPRADKMLTGGSHDSSGVVARSVREVKILAGYEIISVPNTERPSTKTSGFLRLEPPPRPEMAGLDTPQSSWVSKLLRRSARVAARQQRLGVAAAAPSGTAKNASQSTTKLAQAPTSLSSTEPQERKATSLTAKPAKRVRMKQVNRRDASKPRGISKKRA